MALSARVLIRVYRSISLMGRLGFSLLVTPMSWFLAWARGCRSWMMRWKMGWMGVAGAGWASSGLVWLRARVSSCSCSCWLRAMVVFRLLICVCSSGGDCARLGVRLAGLGRWWGCAVRGRHRQ